MGAWELSVREPLATSKLAEATALPRETTGVRQGAPSILHMVIRSPRGSTTEMLILTPSSIIFALDPAKIVSASESVKLAKIALQNLLKITRMGVNYGNIVGEIGACE